MRSANWVELLVGVVILGALGWLGSTVFDMKGTLAKTSDRVERIARALPGLGHRVAMEEVSGPFSVAVVATEPIESSDGSWAVRVNVVDPDKSELLIFNLPLKSQTDRIPILTLTGAMHRADPRATSFYELASWSAEADKPAAIPNVFDTYASFVLRNTSPRDTIRALSWISDKPDRVSLTSTPRTWVALVPELTSNFQKFAGEK